MNPKGYVAIVDVYQPTRRLAPLFRAAGYDCIRVQSTPEVPGVYRNGPIPDDFTDDIIHDGNLTATIDKVAGYRPVAVLAGGESGVEFADLLSDALGTPSNGLRLSSARRDKYSMIEAVKSAGLRGARQLNVHDAEQLRSWHEQIGGRIVLKPARSAASVGVTFCDTPEQSVEAYRSLAGADSVFSEPNAGVVAQEYLMGTEYMVNTASRDGLHRICDIWKTTRLSLNGVPDLVDGIYLMPRAGEVQNLLVDYCRRVLDALEIRHGLAHVEVRLTPDGPCLIEVGARMAGADLPYYAQRALGSSQLDWAVDAYTRPEVFRARYDEDYEIRQHFATIPMLSPLAGTLRKYRSLDVIESLDSFDEILQAVTPGGQLRRTVDDTTIPLAVNLMHDVEEVVHRDSRTLRYLDGPDFYEIDYAA